MVGLQAASVKTPMAALMAANGATGSGVVWGERAAELRYGGEDEYGEERTDQGDGSGPDQRPLASSRLGS